MITITIPTLTADTPEPPELTRWMAAESARVEAEFEAPGPKHRGTPTLGWLTTDSAPMLSEWCATSQTDPGYDDFGEWVTGMEFGVRRETVTAFTPAVAVPASALDELRANFRPIPLDRVLTLQEKSIRTFLRAVDQANGDAS